MLSNVNFDHNRVHRFGSWLLPAGCWGWLRRALLWRHILGERAVIRLLTMGFK